MNSPVVGVGHCGRDIASHGILLLANIAGISLEALARTELGVAVAAARALLDVGDDTSIALLGRGEVDELDEAAVIGPVGIGAVADIGRVAPGRTVPLKVLVDLDDIDVGETLEGGIAGNVDGHGGVGDRIGRQIQLRDLLHGVDNVACAVVDGGRVGTGGRDGRTSEEWVDSTSGTVALAPATINDEQLVALVDATGADAVVLARNVLGDVDLVVPLVEGGDDAIRGRSTDCVVGDGRLGQDLRHARRGIQIALHGLIASIGAVVEVGNAELLAGRGTLVHQAM